MTKVYCSISKTVVSKNFVPKQGLSSWCVRGVRTEDWGGECGLRKRSSHNRSQFAALSIPHGRHRLFVLMLNYID
jgi:hypothetical protein